MHSINPPGSVQFGWRRQTAFKVPVHAEDMQSMEKAIPGDEFVWQISEKMIGDADEAPRAIIIPNPLGFFKTPQRVRQFQCNLTPAVIERLSIIAPALFPPANGKPRHYAIGYRKHFIPNQRLHQDYGYLVSFASEVSPQGGGLV